MLGKMRMRRKRTSGGASGKRHGAGSEGCLMVTAERGRADFLSGLLEIGSGMLSQHRPTQRYADKSNTERAKAARLGGGDWGAA